MYKKILVPTDGSEVSKKAVMNAFDMAKQNEAELIILSVASTDHNLGLPAGDAIAQINALLLEEAKKNVEKAAAMNKYDIAISKRVVEGNPSKEIIKMTESEKVDLLVIGSTGKTGFDKFVLGSVADKVIKTVKSAILLIH